MTDTTDMIEVITNETETENTHSLDEHPEDVTSDGLTVNDTPDILNDIEVLRAEIAALKEELVRKTAEANMIRGQLVEFSELFPDVTPEDIPNEVWQSGAATGSLAAAYALYHRRAQVQKNRVNELNQKNAELSTGKVGVDSAKEYFTPNEVRAMSRSQVHANYSKILDSMKKWN